LAHHPPQKNNLKIKKSIPITLPPFSLPSPVEKPLKPPSLGWTGTWFVDRINNETNAAVNAKPSTLNQEEFGSS
jgi:hypothetical protein